MKNSMSPSRLAFQDIARENLRESIKAGRKLETINCQTRLYEVEKGFRAMNELRERITR